MLINPALKMSYNYNCIFIWHNKDNPLHYPKVKCPHCKHISTPETEKRKTSHKYGSFTRQSDGRRISRYKCVLCKKTYSSATDDLAYYQKKRRINYHLKNLLASNVSLRRAAKILKVSRTTIDRKLKFLGMTSRLENKAFLEQYTDNIEFIQLDELLTIEHTKCKPLAVLVVISKHDRKILATEVSSMPAFGHLVRIAKKKYGFRPDLRKKGYDNVK